LDLLFYLFFKIKFLNLLFYYDSAFLDYKYKALF
jgi:hypothetical protein